MPGERSRSPDFEKERSRGPTIVRGLLGLATVGLAIGAVLAAISATAVIGSNGYLALRFHHLIWAVSADEFARWTLEIFGWLVPAAAIAATLWAGIRRVRPRSFEGRAFRFLLATILALLFALAVGYRVNYLEYGVEWRTLGNLWGVPVPEALFLPTLIYQNLLIAGGTAAIGLLAYFVGGFGGTLRKIGTIRAAVIAMTPLVAAHAMELATTPRGTEDLPNLLLVTVDTFRADRLGAGSPFGPLTPNLDRLADRGARFGRAYSMAPWTLPSMASVMTGEYPSEHGADDYDRVFAANKVTLAEVLRERGYRTAGIVFSAYVDPYYGFGQGFETYSHLGTRMRRSDVTSDWIADRAIKWLRKNREGPFFLFVHFFDPHYNYVSQGKTDLAGYRGPVTGNHDIFELRRIQRSLTPKDLAVLGSFYDEEVQFTDHHVGRVLEELDGLGIADRTVVAFTSDHGEEFLEHGWIGHTRNLYEGMVRVPLILRDPRTRFDRKIVGEPVQIHRLPATLLDLLDAAPPEGAFPGETLRGLLAGDPEDLEAPAFTAVLFSRRDKRSMKRSVVKGDLKLIYDYDSRRFEFYNLREDPGETTDLVATDAPEMEDLKQLLSTWAVRMDAARELPEESSPAELDDTVLERLKALGYVQ